MKKLQRSIALILFLCLAAGCLTGCNGESSSATEATQAQTGTATVSTEAEEMKESETTQKATEETTVPETTEDATQKPSEDLVATDTAGDLARVYLPEEYGFITDGNIEAQGWKFGATNEDVLILGARMDRAQFEDNGREFPESITEYVSLVYADAELYPVGDDRFYAIALSSVNEEPMFYFLLFAEGEDAFWEVHFICHMSQSTTLQPYFELWGSLMELK